MNKLKVAVVGCGFVAQKRHIPSFLRLKDDVSLCAVCDLNQDLARSVANRFGVPNAYSDLSEMLLKEHPDIVDVCTPPKVHAPVAVESMESGCHVLLEKPMASASFVDEGLPSKVFEYQAYGKPIICVSGGEPASYVEATGSGLVVKPNDANGFAEAVVRLYKNRKFASELGWNGWHYVSTNLTTEKIGKHMYEVFASLKG